MNIDYVSSKKNLTSEIVIAALNDINARRFSGKFQIIATYPTFFDINSSEWHFGLNVGMLTSKRKLSVRRAEITDPCNYITSVFMHELGKIFSGRCSTEDSSIGTWAPNTKKYKSYRDYFLKSKEHWKTIPKLANMIEAEYKKSLTMIPTEFKDIL